METHQEWLLAYLRNNLKQREVKEGKKEEREGESGKGERPAD